MKIIILILITYICDKILDLMPQNKVFFVHISGEAKTIEDYNTLTHIDQLLSDICKYMYMIKCYRYFRNLLIKKKIWQRVWFSTCSRLVVNICKGLKSRSGWKSDKAKVWNLKNHIISYSIQYELHNITCLLFSVSVHLLMINFISFKGNSFCIQ